jgi:hypothetical protein
VEYTSQHNTKLYSRIEETRNDRKHLKKPALMNIIGDKRSRTIIYSISYIFFYHKCVPMSIDFFSGMETERECFILMKSPLSAVERTDMIPKRWKIIIKCILNIKM